MYVCDMQVLGVDGITEVGKITKQWGGFAKEFFTDADNFGIQCKVYVIIIMMIIFINPPRACMRVLQQLSYLFVGLSVTL